VQPVIRDSRQPLGAKPGSDHAARDHRDGNGHGVEGWRLAGQPPTGRRGYDHCREAYGQVQGDGATQREHEQGDEHRQSKLGTTEPEQTAEHTNRSARDGAERGPGLTSSVYV
jgi:hypothetical protein